MRWADVAPARAWSQAGRNGPRAVGGPLDLERLVERWTESGSLTAGPRAVHGPLAEERFMDRWTKQARLMDRLTKGRGWG